MKFQIREFILDKGSLHASWWASLGWGQGQVNDNLASMG